ncbi:MAG: DUF1616 domain-containing protein [Candidatus Altiarchaeota archaeon]|nr:DUF1616 domain-containing protein [Candidatus Altiarchaeota archaeon]
MDVLSLVRVVLGLFFYLFVPGFAVSYAIFPKEEIDLIERITLSLAFSVTMTPLFVLILNLSLGVEYFPIDLLHSLLASLFLIFVSCLVWLYRVGRLRF